MARDHRPGRPPPPRRRHRRHRRRHHPPRPHPARLPPGPGPPRIPSAAPKQNRIPPQLGSHPTRIQFTGIRPVQAGHAGAARAGFVYARFARAGFVSPGPSAPGSSAPDWSAPGSSVHGGSSAVPRTAAELPVTAAMRAIERGALLAGAQIRRPGPGLLDLMVPGHAPIPVEVRSPQGSAAPAALVDGVLVFQIAPHTTMARRARRSGRRRRRGLPRSRHTPVRPRGRSRTLRSRTPSRTATPTQRPAPGHLTAGPRRTTGHRPPDHPGPGRRAARRTGTLEVPTPVRAPAVPARTHQRDRVAPARGVPRGRPMPLRPPNRNIRRPDMTHPRPADQELTGPDRRSPRPIIDRRSRRTDGRPLTEPCRLHRGECAERGAGGRTMRWPDCGNKDHVPAGLREEGPCAGRTAGGRITRWPYCGSCRDLAGHSTGGTAALQDERTSDGLRGGAHQG